MADYVNELAALLTVGKVPSGVGNEEELKEWLKRAEGPLEAWAGENAARLFAAEGDAKPEDVPVDAPPAAEKKEEAEVKEEAPAAKEADRPAPLKAPEPAATGAAEDIPTEAMEVSDPRLREEWEKVRDDNDPASFLLLGFEQIPGSPSKSRKVVVVGRGNNGRAGLVDKVEDDQLMFGGFRVSAIDERGGVTSSRTKFVFVQWVGEKLGGMARARVTMLRPDFDNIFTGTHLTLQTGDRSELTEEELTTSLHRNTGAHKPGRYEY